MRKYKLLKKDSIEYYGKTLYRIEAIRDIPIQEVKKGDIGGYIEKYDNLEDNGWVSGNGRVYGNGVVSDNGRVSGNGMVCGDGWVYGDGRVSGNGWVSGNGRVYGNGWINKGELVGLLKTVTLFKYTISISDEYIFAGCKRWSYAKFKKLTYDKVKSDINISEDEFKKIKKIVLLTIKL